MIRKRKVLLDAHLAALYGVETRSLVQAVRRNIERFPADFMFQLTASESEILRSQSVISKSVSRTTTVERRGGRRYRPYAFTEQGVAMLSSVLKSPRAIAVNVAIMRVFVRLRRTAAGHAHLARRIDELETRHDAQFKVVFDAIRQLVMPAASRSRRVGFHSDDGEQ